LVTSVPAHIETGSLRSFPATRMEWIWRGGEFGGGNEGKVVGLWRLR
jgi:hypothetical protein